MLPLDLNLLVSKEKELLSHWYYLLKDTIPQVCEGDNAAIDIQMDFEKNSFQRGLVKKLPSLEAKAGRAWDVSFSSSLLHQR